MKNRMFCAMCTFVAITLTCVAQEKAAPARNIAEHRARMIEAAGGLLQIPDRDPGVCFANGQTLVDGKVVEDCAKAIKDLFNINVFVNGDKYTSIGALAKVKPMSKHGAIIALTEMPTMPALLVAPDANWAVVNVSALASDKPNAGVLAKRVEKEMWRAFAQVMGCGWTTTQGCILKPASNNRELDRIGGRVIGPDATGRIFAKIRLMNLPTGGSCTYQRACEEGWAPAPTNEVQQVIWDKVHTIPANPMKIEFDPKKGR